MTTEEAPRQGNGPAGDDPVAPAPGRPEAQRFAWALTGSGHFLKEAMEVAETLPDLQAALERRAQWLKQRSPATSS